MTEQLAKSAGLFTMLAAANLAARAWAWMAFHDQPTLLGTALLALAAANLVILLGVWRSLRDRLDASKPG